MQLTGQSRQGWLWRNLTRFEAAKIATDIAIRNTIGIVSPLVLGAASGYPSTGVVGALGALQVAYSDNRGPYIWRARQMLLSSGVCAIAVLAGALAGHSHVATVVVAALWAFGAGMLGLLGANAGDLGVITLVTLVIFAAQPLPVEGALQMSLVAFAGGVFQTLLSVAVWPFGRYQPERRIIAELYRTLAKLASTPAGPEAAPPGSEQFNRTQDALTSLAQDHSVEAERHVFLLNQAERIRLSLLTLRRLHRRLMREEQGGAATAAIERILGKASLSLELVSQSAIEGKPTGAGLTEDARVFHAFEFEEEHAPFLSALIRDAAHQIDALAGQLRAVARLAGDFNSPQSPAQSNVLWQLRITGWRARLLSNLSLQSTVFRHALRLAVCVGLGEAIGLGFHLERTYWLPMTIAIVLKPDFAATFSRGILRIAGTFAGLLLATGLIYFLRTGMASDIALLAVFAFLLRWLGPANYGIFAMAISSFVVLLIAMTGVDPKPVIAVRALNTAIGGALALLAYRLWPTWEHPQAGPVLANLLEAYRNYFRGVADDWAGHADADLDSVRSRARIARANAEAFAGRVASEPGIPIERANLINAILVSSHSFVRAAMALESDLYSLHSEPASPAMVQFTRQVDETLAQVTDALRASKPVPHNLPDLRAAHNLIEDRYGLFAVEADRMVTGLNTLRDQIAKLLHEP